MRTFFILILLSLVGIGIAFGVSFYADMQKSGNNTPLPSLKLPYKNFIAATGVVEANSKNIFVGSLVSGIIKKVYVRSGDSIKKGDLLFEIDESEKRVQIPLQKAEINASKAKLQSTRHQLELIKKMKKLSSNMVTNEKYTKVLDNYNEAKALYQLSLKKLQVVKKELELFRVYAPIDGIVLRSNITQSSYFDKQTKALIIGSNKLNLRVNINDFDSWKLDKNSVAVASLRGNPKQQIYLKQKYIIPFIVPKKNLTGLSTEQTDTRVLQVVYELQHKPDFPLYVGEMFDVFIKTSKVQ